MSELHAINLGQITTTLTPALTPVRILWQEADTLAFIARGREHRSEFHVDPSDEVMYMIKGEMQLHYLTPDGEQKIAVIREGEIIYCPGGPRIHRALLPRLLCWCWNESGGRKSRTDSCGSANDATRSSTKPSSTCGTIVTTPSQKPTKNSIPPRHIEPAPSVATSLPAPRRQFSCPTA